MGGLKQPALGDTIGGSPNAQVHCRSLRHPTRGGTRTAIAAHVRAEHRRDKP